MDKCVQCGGWMPTARAQYLSRCERCSVKSDMKTVLYVPPLPKKKQKSQVGGEIGVYHESPFTPVDGASLSD